MQYKLNPDGSIARYKARWVAKGFEQIYRVDYTATSSTVVKSASWKVLMALAARYNMEIEHSDVDTAFLEAKLNDEVWVEQPHAYTNGNKHQACRLNKALYGLKQSAKEWYDTLRAHLDSLGFSHLVKDHSIFKHPNGTIIATYVDDLLILTKDRALMASIKAQLDIRFKIKHLGPVSYYLGMEIIRNQTNRSL